MAKELNEKKALRKLGIDDFRHLTKAKVIDLVSLLDKMDPEVAKKAIEQFPDFANITSEILSEYKEIIIKGIECNDKSNEAVYVMYNSIIESMKEMLKKDDLAFEEKRYILEQMREIAELIDKKDSENKRWIAGMTFMVGTFVLGSLAVLASALGGNTHVEPVNFSANV